MSAESTAVTPYPGLEEYLSRLYSTTHAQTRIRADGEGRVRGRYFNSTLTSAFQPIRKLHAPGHLWELPQAALFAKATPPDVRDRMPTRSLRSIAV